jgi:hypothetical protein
MNEQNWRFVETREVQAWNAVSGEVLQVFTDLGEFVSERAEKFVPYARRVAYAGKGRHHASRTRRPGAWIRSKLRDAGDWAFGSFRFLSA